MLAAIQPINVKHIEVVFPLSKCRQLSNNKTYKRAILAKQHIIGQRINYSEPNVIVLKVNSGCFFRKRAILFTPVSSAGFLHSYLHFLLQCRLPEYALKRGQQQEYTQVVGLIN